MRHKPADGTIVCTACGLVGESRVIEQAKEYRVFEDSGKEQEHYGSSLKSIDQVNRMRLEWTGGNAPILTKLFR